MFTRRSFVQLMGLTPFFPKFFSGSKTEVKPEQVQLPVEQPPQFYDFRELLGEARKVEPGRVIVISGLTASGRTSLVREIVNDRDKTRFTTNYQEAKIGPYGLRLFPDFWGWKRFVSDQTLPHWLHVDRYFSDFMEYTRALDSVGIFVWNSPRRSFKHDIGCSHSMVFKATLHIQTKVTTDLKCVAHLTKNRYGFAKRSYLIPIG